MQDRPTAVELLRAAQAFCEDDLMEATTGRVRFHVRVLRNVLHILEREWEGEEAALRAEWQRLGVLLGQDTVEPASLAELRDQVRRRNADLSEQIRRGNLDGRLDEARDVLRATVADKLAIANPRYVEGR